MKLIFILLGFVAVVSAIHQERVKVPEEKLARVHKISNACAAEFNVDGPGLITRIADGTLPRDETTNKYLYCFAVKAGLVDDVGHIVVDKLAELLGDHPKVEEFKETLTKCNDVTKEDVIATVVQMHKCYGTTSPVLVIY